MNIGIDLVEISRIGKLYDEYGDKFLRKFMTEFEMNETKTKSDIPRYAAKCWAVKEASIKATNITDMKRFTYAKCGDKPVVLEFDNVHISLSDEKNSVVAIAIFTG